MQVVGEIASIERLVDSIRGTQPDMLLLEWELVSGESVRMVAELKRHFPELEIVAMSGRPELRKKAVAAGVDGFISKVDPPERLVSQLHSVGSARLQENPVHAGRRGSTGRQKD